MNQSLLKLSLSLLFTFQVLGAEAPDGQDPNLPSGWVDATKAPKKKWRVGVPNAQPFIPCAEIMHEQEEAKRSQKT